VKSFLVFCSRLLREVGPGELGRVVGFFYIYLFLFGVFMMVCAMCLGGLPEQANDRLACLGRLGI